MRKSFRIGLALVAACALASCGDQPGNPIEKDLAVQKLTAAVEGMSNVRGIKIDGSLNAQVETKDFEEDVSDSISLKADVDAAAILDNEAGVQASVNLDASLDIITKVGAETGTGSMDISADMYVDFTNFYSKLTRELGEQENTTYVVMPASELQSYVMEIANGILGLLAGGSSSPASVRYAENTDSSEEPTLVDMIVGLLPNPTLKTSGKTETISIAITNDFIKGVATALAPVLVDMSDLTDEEVAQATQMLVDTFTKMINIKTLKASVSIYDGKIISGVTADANILISTLADDGETVTGTLEIDANANVKIKELGANDTIKYPADLSEWESRMEASIA